MAGQNNYLDIRIILLQSFEDIQTVYTRHSQIQDDNIRDLILDKLKGLLTVIGNLGIQFPHLNPFRQRINKLFFIVDQKYFNLFHGITPYLMFFNSLDIKRRDLQISLPWLLGSDKAFLGTLTLCS